MTALVLIGLAQLVLLAVVTVWALREQRSANRYRRSALGLQGDRLDVDLATWARVAGRKAVVTDKRREDEEAREQYAEEFVAHPPIVTNGADV